jgi:hypothetical protein
MKSGLLNSLQAASNTAADAVAAPVDVIAWLLRKAGVPVPANPAMGSDWMRQQGLTAPTVPGASQAAGETLGLLSPIVAAAKAPQIAKGLLQAGANAAAPRTLGTQRGVIGPFKRNDRSASEYADLISSQRFVDRNTVARKIKDRDFTVAVTPKFEVDGEMVRAIQDGHHSLEAAIKSGHRPKFIEQTATMNDRVGLLNSNQVETFLEASYMDSPWYKWATKQDIW